tara:strand:- start:2228 stop:3562 length:1335 start_codon:yes stop_codon:yes gene_type:complete
MKRLLLLVIICISSVSFGQVPDYVPTDSLVGWWGFNGNANDESGNGNNGTVNGATLTTDRFGNSNSAYEFDGVNDEIIIAHTPKFNSTELTISVWFYLNNNAFSNSSCCNLDGQWLISKSPINIPGGTKNRAFEITVDNGVSNLLAEPFYFQSGSSNQAMNTQYQMRSDQVIYSNNWYHGIYAISNNNLKQYLNGVLVVDSTINDSFRVNNNDILLGSYWGEAAVVLTERDMDGILDDIGIWNRALDSCEIKDLYEGSLGNCCTPNPITSQPTDVTVPLNGIGMFSITTSITSPTYQWQMNDGTGYTDLFNAGQFSGVDTDMLSVSNVTLGQNNTLFRCIVTENSNCSDTTDVAVLTVEDNTGLDDLNKDIFNVYPNPTSNSFTISSDNLINSEFKLIDAQGREVLTGFMNGQEHTIDISKLSNGVYSVVFNNTEYPVVSLIKE